MTKNYNLNVTETRDSDFKNSFPGIFSFAVGIILVINKVGSQKFWRQKYLPEDEQKLSVSKSSKMWFKNAATGVKLIAGRLSQSQNFWPTPTSPSPGIASPTQSRDLAL